MAICPYVISHFGKIYIKFSVLFFEVIWKSYNFPSAEHSYMASSPGPESERKMLFYSKLVSSFFLVLTVQQVLF